LIGLAVTKIRFYTRLITSILRWLYPVAEVDPVSQQSRLPTASFAYIPDCQQSNCL